MGRRMLVPMILALAAPALAQESFRHGRIRHVEPAVMLQRASETSAEDAIPNLPFLPGDRLWTDGSGRAEFQFADGSILRLDSRSKLDYVAHEEGRRDERIVLELWSGGIYVRTRGNRDFPDFEIDTPGGVVETGDRGVYRIDVDSGETRLTVYDGEATLDSGGGRVSVEAGMRTYARRGEEPETPDRFDRGEMDDFARWDEDRQDHQAWAGSSQRYLPDDVDPYAGELDAYGSWYYEAEMGHVWRPYVGASWRPYCDGRWIWTSYGWTWVPYEPWGWVTFHYGRWGYSPVIGWYWIPGSLWGPAWVQWSVSSDYVGWCPLGYRDRPVIIHEMPATKGHAVPRPTTAASTSTPATAPVEGGTAAWVFVPKGDLWARDIAKRRVAVKPGEVASLRVVDGQRLRLGRDLRIADASPASRSAKTKPTIGDYVPELRSDPATTIPLPTPRRRTGDSREEERKDRTYRTEGSARDVHPTDARSPHGESPIQLRRPSDTRPPRDIWTQSETRTPSDGRSQRETSATRPEAREPERQRTERERAQGERGGREIARPRDPDHEILRRFFQPLSEPRSRSRDDSSKSEPRQATPSRHEPQRAAPATPATSSSTAKERAHRDKEKEH